MLRWIGVRRRGTRTARPVWGTEGMTERRRLLACTALAAALLASPAVQAAELDAGAEIWFDNRLFFQPPEWEGQTDARLQPSIAATADLTLTSEAGHDTLRLVPFGRIDPYVTDRSHWDIREGYYLHQDDGWDLLVGASRVFWGVTESRHLVNIINQSDYLEDIDGEDYLGQPMVNLSLFGDWGTLDLYAMTGFRERQFPNSAGRYSLPISIDEGAAEFESDLKHWQPDLAVHFRTTLDNWDFGLSHFYGTSRDPRFKVVLDPAARFLPTSVQNKLTSLSIDDLNKVDDLLAGTGLSTPKVLHIADSFISLAPVYDVINQSGIEALGVYDDLLLKFEGVTITGHGGARIWSAVGGFEYTFTDFANSGFDLGLLGEAIYDSRDLDDGPYTIFDNDIFAGVRLSFNDLDTTSVLVGGYVDWKLGTTILTAEIERRIFDNIKLSVEARGYPYVSDQDPLAVFKQDSYVQVRLSFFF